MTWVKICGITNLQDAQVAIEAGADALGFVFYDKSPRKISRTAARDIAAELPAHIDKVGVFVDISAEEIIDVVRKVHLSGAQFHAQGHLKVDDVAVIKEANADLKMIYVLPGRELIDGGLFVSERARKLLYALMFDSGSADRPGGTGEQFDWAGSRGMVQMASLTIPVIVAGGLNAANVKAAIRLFQPFGVDVSSGVETSPGKKDPAKVRAFIQAVREADKAA